MILFYLLVAVMPLMQSDFWSKFVGELTLIKYLGGACFLYALLYAAVRPTSPRFLATPQAWAFVVLASLATVSFLMKGAPVPWEISPLLSYVSFLLLFYVTLVVVDSPTRLRWVFLSAVGSVAFGSLHAIREWQKYGGLSATFRPGWLMGDPNYFTMSALVCLPLAFYLMSERRWPWQRFFCIACLIVTVVAITLAASRGGFLGLVAALVFIALHSRQRLRSVTLTGALVFCLSVVSPVAPVERLLAPTPSDLESSAIREALWQAGLQMIQANPWDGVGLGNFQPLLAYYGITRPHEQFVAHNMYIEIAAELGLVALLAFLVILFGSFRSLEQVRRASLLAGLPLLHYASLGIQAGLAGYMVAGFFLSAQYQKLFWLMVFLSMCMASLVPRPPKGGSAQ